MKLINKTFITGSNQEDASNPDFDNDKNLTLEELKKREEEERKKKEEGKEHKHSKFHDMLQEWANDNERDIEEDDTDPLKSGL